MRNFAYQRAGDVHQACALHGDDHRADFIAGGTNLIDMVKLDIMRPDRLVDVNRLPLTELVALDDGRLKVGALVTNTDLAHDERVAADYTVLSEALLSGASTQLRNVATTAGNVMQRTRCPYFRNPARPCNKREPGSGCSALEGINRNHAVLGGSDQCIAVHPSDMCVAMTALGATVSVEGVEGKRDVAFEDYHLRPGDTPEREHDLRDGELITHVTLDAPLEGARSHYLKLRDRASYEFALASCAAVVALDGDTIREARIALGGVGTKPWRSREAEAVLDGQPATEATFTRAAEAALADAKAQHDNAFKIPLAKQAIVRALTTVTTN
ncbi:FAD binding domain-containing protein [Chromohalobacter israelensis]|uniref:FAD binding domain-containing protein n=1 Tax=Chromohalobacter israelensis TaxID=141390 RepID=UPI000FFF3FC8|nr:xanthine dehydrogenase family protein subunit M [Chromohalobacter salexigens]RXE47053.1 xanthine dehydrogenase [Chromohalobacter salexigens]